MSKLALDTRGLSLPNVAQVFLFVFLVASRDMTRQRHCRSGFTPDNGFQSGLKPDLQARALDE